MPTILFDLDGTLTDPRVGITMCISHALERLGHTAPDPDSLCWCIGPPLRGSFVQLVGEAAADEAVELYRERFATIGLYENEVYREIPRTLESLRASGHRLFVATSKPAVYAQQILEHFGLHHHFAAVYGSELDGSRTHKVELLDYILQREDFPAGEAVMIGDREHDVLAAKAHGMRSIGVLYGYGSHQELTTAGADCLCDSPEGLVPVLEQLWTATVP